MINLLEEIIHNIQYDYNQWKWSRKDYGFETSNPNPEIDWNFILGLLFGIGYLICTGTV